MTTSIRISLPPGSQFSRLSSWTLTGLVTAFVNLILVVSAVAAFFMLLVGGLRFILAGGEKAATEAATRSMVNALIGLLLVFSVYGLMGMLSEFFGVQLLYFTIISI